MRIKSSVVVLVLITLFVGAIAAQSQRLSRKDLVESIEDPDTFGKTVNFLGTLRSSSFVVLDETCVFPPGELAPGDRCKLIAAAPGMTVFDERDLGSITLPGNSAKTNIYLIPTHIHDYQFFNGTGSLVDGALFVYNPYVTIEGAALNDPRAVDPFTNVPLNGKLDIGLSSAKLVDRTLNPNERILTRDNYSRALITGINKPFLASEMGLPADIVNRLFREPLTIRLNMRGRTRFVNAASFIYHVRIMGN